MKERRLNEVRYRVLPYLLNHYIFDKSEIVLQKQQVVPKDYCNRCRVLELLPVKLLLLSRFQKYWVYNHIFQSNIYQLHWSKFAH